MKKIMSNATPSHEEYKNIGKHTKSIHTEMYGFSEKYKVDSSFDIENLSIQIILYRL